MKKIRDLPAGMLQPDYDGIGIVNLMSSISTGRGAGASAYKPLQQLGDLSLSKYRNILLILIDGLGYDYLRREWPDSIMTRHLRGPITSVFPTTTAAAITTFQTGLAPAQHGITGWHMWFREISTLAAVLPFRTRVRHESLKSRGEDPATLLDARPLYPKLDVASHVISPSRIANSPFNLAFTRGAQIHKFDRLDQFYQTINAVIDADTESKYIYAYWPDLDHIGHQYGMGSKRARHHFQQLDDGFSRLLGKLENSDTLVLLTADHGFVDTVPATRINVADHLPLTAMLEMPLCGEPRAAYCYVHKGEGPSFATYVGAELADSCDVVDSTSLLDAGLFGPGEAHPRLHQRIGDYTLLMKDNFIITDTLPGESPTSLIGAHGGLSSDELYVPLVVVET